MANMTPEEKLLQGIETVIQCCNKQIADSEAKNVFNASMYLVATKLEDLVTQYKLAKKNN